MLRPIIAALMLVGLAATIAPTASAVPVAACGGDTNPFDDNGVTVTCGAASAKCSATALVYSNPVPDAECDTGFVCVCQLPPINIE